MEENHIQLYRKTNPGKYAQAKGVGVLPYPPLVCMAMLTKSSYTTIATPNSYAAALSPDQLESYVLQDLSGNGHTRKTTLNYMRFKGVPFVVSSRDFVNLTHWRILPNGSILVSAVSADQDMQAAHCPPIPGNVRADAKMGGWLFEPVDTASCRVTLIVCLDLKGMIPGWVIAQVTKTQPLSIGRLGTLLDQDALQFAGDTTNVGGGERNVTPQERQQYIHNILQANVIANTEPATATTAAAATASTTDSSGETAQQLEYQKVCTKINTMLHRAVALANNESPEWKLMFDYQGVHAETLEDGSALLTVRGVLDMPYPPYAILRLINACNDMEDPRSFRKAPSMKSTKLLNAYDAHTSLRYLEYKGLAFVSGRDFCNIHHWRLADREQPTGAIHSVAYEEERLDLCPLVTGLVRGKLVIAGYVLEPVGEQEVRTRVTYVVKTDIGGSIPGWVIKMKAKEQPMQLLTLQTMLNEEAESYPGGRTKYVHDMLRVPEKCM